MNIWEWNGSIRFHRVQSRHTMVINIPCALTQAHRWRSTGSRDTCPCLVLLLCGARGLLAFTWSPGSSLGSPSCLAMARRACRTESQVTSQTLLQVLFENSHM